MDLFATLAPFVLGIIMAALAPELSGAVRDRVESVMHQAEPKVPTAGKSPPHTSKEYVGDYVEYAADAAQTIPSLLLPLVGAALVLKDNQLAISTVLLLVVIVPRCLYIFFTVIKVDPLSYVARKYLRARYTFLPLAAMVMNSLASAIVVFAHLLS